MYLQTFLKNEMQAIPKHKHSVKSDKYPLLVEQLQKFKKIVSKIKFFILFLFLLAKLILKYLFLLQHTYFESINNVSFLPSTK